MPRNPTLLLEDWAELLGAAGMAASLQAGTAFPHEVREQLGRQRDTYPDVPLDYIRALDGLLALVTRVELAVAEQNHELDELNGVLRDAGLMPFLYDPRRLLTEDERFQLEGRLEEIAAAAEEARREAEEAEDLARELEQQQADLEDEQIEQEDEQDRQEDLARERREAEERNEPPPADPGPSAGDDGEADDGESDGGPNGGRTDDRNGG